VGTGKLQLRGDNTFDGNMTLTNGLVDVYSDNAFGSTVGSTSYNYNNNGWHMIFHGVTTPESFTVKSNDKSSIVKFESGTTNVFLGPIKGSTNERWSLDNKTKVVFSNTVDGIGCWCLAFQSTSVAEFWKNTTHANVLYFSGSGSVYWHAPGRFNGSNASSAGFRLDGNTHYLCCTNVTSYKNEAGWVNSQHASTVDLCGNDQRARWLASGFTATVVKSADPAILHLLNGDAGYTNTYAGTFQGKVNVSVEGPRGLILTGDSTSLGFLAMTNNARVQITSGGWAGTNVFLGGGAELIVAGTPFIHDAVLDVETASGTTKYILPEGVVQQVRTLIVDGEEKPAGVYVAEEGAVVDGTPVGFISGKGAINVLGTGPIASDGVWDGGAGDSDISFLTAANWEGDVVPEHDLGLVNVTFATGSSTNCAIPGAISVNGGVFTADRNFRLSKTSESSVFGAAGGGLSFPDAAAGTAWTNTFAVPYRINAAQTWNVGANRTAVFDEPVMSSGDGAVVIQGGGEVVFNAANTYAGAMRLEAGTMRFATPAAFGGAGASFTVNASVLNGATAWFPKGEISVPIAMDQSASYPAIEFPEGETVVLNGELRLSGNAGEGCRLHLRNGSELVLSGGVRGQGYLRVNKHPAQTGPARIVVTNTPTSHYDFAGDTAGVVLYTPLTEFVLAVTNCLPGRLNVLQKKYFTVSGGWARCAVTNALKCEATLGPVLRMTPSSDGTGVFDLDGYDQEVWRVEGGYNASQKTVVKSADPAVMSVVGSIGTYVTDQETNCGADFQGLVTLRRAGSGTTTLRGISSTAGRLVVESGKVEFAGVGAMTNLSEVAVSGGELAIDTEARIGAGADFRLSGGTVKISSGVEQHCKWMYVPKVGGTSPWRRARCGRYTSATCDYISGGGAIVVDGDGSGMTVIFK
jgi:autotransporter-associated beta strand protein